MAKRKRPSGDDPVPHDAVVVTPEAVPVDAPTIDAPALSEGQIYADLLNDHGALIERIAIRESDKSFQIHHAGNAWRHVSDHADGTWQFAK